MRVCLSWNHRRLSALNQRRLVSVPGRLCLPDCGCAWVPGRLAVSACLCLCVCVYVLATRPCVCLVCRIGLWAWGNGLTLSTEREGNATVGAKASSLQRQGGTPAWITDFLSLPLFLSVPSVILCFSYCPLLLFGFLYFSLINTHFLLLSLPFFPQSHLMSSLLSFFLFPLLHFLLTCFFSSYVFIFHLPLDISDSPIYTCLHPLFLLCSPNTLFSLALSLSHAYSISPFLSCPFFLTLITTFLLFSPIFPNPPFFTSPLFIQRGICFGSVLSLPIL